MVAIPYRIHEGLAVYQFGSGQPVLVMPGPHRFERPGLRVADALLYGLRDLGRRVITFDPQGSGHSARTAQLGMAEMHDCADEALAVCAVRDLSTCWATVWRASQAWRTPSSGLSGSGAWCWSARARAGLAYMGAPGALWNRTHPAFPGLVGLAILKLLWPARGPEQAMNNFIQRRSFHDRLAQPKNVTLLDWVRPRERRSDWHRIAKRLNYSPRLREIRVPTLVLCGRRLARRNSRRESRALSLSGSSAVATTPHRGA